MKQFPVRRIYSGEKGDSRFEDILIVMNEAGDIGALSAIQPVKGIIFREVEPSYDYDFHNAPQSNISSYSMVVLKSKHHWVE